MKKLIIKFVSVLILSLIFVAVQAQIVVYDEDFETPPFDVTVTGNPLWSVNTTLYNSGTQSYHNEVAQGDTSFLTTGSFSTVGNSFVLLEFAHICKIGVFDGAIIEVSVDNGTTWTRLTGNEYLGTGQFGTIGNRFVAASYPTLWVANDDLAVPDNTWWRQESFDISAIAGDEADVQIRFVLYDGNNPPGSGGNYGWLIDDIIVSVIPELHDLAVDSIISPVGDLCYSGSEPVTIQIGNYGLDTIFGGFEAAYTVDGGTPVTEIVGATIAPNEQIIHTFATPINFTLPGADSAFILKTYVSVGSDPYSHNDTLDAEVKFLYIPPSPVAINDTVAYGTSATLEVSSPYHINWYATPSLADDNILDTGTVFTTPVLYGNTAYYASANSGAGGFIITEICHWRTAPTGGPTGGWPGWIPDSDYIEITGPLGADLDGYTLEQWDGSSIISTFTFGPGTVLSPSGTAIIIIGSGNDNDPANYVYNGNSGGNFTSGAASGKILIDPSGTIIDAVGYPGSSSYTFPTAAGVDPSQFALTWSPGSASNTAGTRLIGPYTGDDFNWVVSSATYPQDPIEVNPGVEPPVTGCESSRTEVWAIVTNNPAVDVGVVSIDEPVSPTDLQPQNLIVSIQNFGTDPLTSVDIHWTHNGAPQAPFSWTGNLQLSETDSVNIATFTPVMGNNHIVAWTADPNGITDPMPSNDTAYALIVAFEPMCGTYIIGSSAAANFATFNDAVYHLEFNGITCPVVFEVEAGTYNERIELSGSAPGVSATNTVTFIGEPGALIYHTPINSNQRAAIALMGASHYRFDNLHIELDPAADWGWGIYIGNNSEDIEITNCYIQTDVTSANTDNYQGIVASGSPTSTTSQATGIKDILIENNTIIGGSYGVVFYGSSASNIENSYVIGNNFIDQLVYGIRYYYTIEDVATHNNFNLRGTHSSSRAIHIGTSTGPFNFSYNTINNVGQYGIFVNSTNAPPASPSLIANNAIGGGFTNTHILASGIYIASSSNIDIYYNSIYCDAVTGGTFYVATSASGLRVKNNSFVFAGTGNGYAANIQSAASVIEIDHNNYYSYGPNFVYYGAAIPNLAMLQGVGTPPNNDANSVSGDPGYLGSNNLYPTGIVLNDVGTPVSNVIDDINGNSRDATTPDIGAFEYTPSSLDMGIVSIISPYNKCCLSTSTLMSVQLRNYGLNTVTSFDVSYTVNGGTPVTESFTGSLDTDSVIIFDFATTADLFANIPYHIFFEVNLTGDELDINDTLSIYMQPKYDLYSGDYFMGFEPSEDYSQWTVLDINDDGRTWEPGYSSATFANSGTHSARFFNGSTNNGDDWLISPCFVLEAVNTYEIEFWYRAESATYPQTITLLLGDDLNPSSFTDTLVHLFLYDNTTYMSVTSLVTVPTDGVYHFGWHATSPAANWYAYIDDINIRLIPPQEAAAVDMLMPSSGCDLGLDTVAISIVNTGGSTISGNMTASYQVTGSPTIVTENVTATINVLDTLLFEFSTLVDLSTTQDSVFEIVAWIDLLDDPFAFNDTVSNNITSVLTPNLPTGIPDTVNYGQQATLIATSNGIITWYDDSLSTSSIHSGDTLITPPLFATTHYYAEASVKVPFIDSLETTFAMGNGCSNGNMFNLTALQNDLDIVGFTLTPQTSDPNASVSVYYKAGTYFGFETNSSAWTYVGSYTYNAVADVPVFVPCDAFTIPVGQEYGIYLNYSAAYTTITSYETYSNTDIELYGGAGLCGYFSSIYALRIFNGRVHYQTVGAGCQTAKVPVEAYVILPQYEAGANEIIAPLDESCSDNTEYVTLRISNNGYDDITNDLTATYIVNGSTPVSETVNITVPAGDTILFTFATPINLNLTTGDTTLHIVAYVNHPDDPYQVNDTTETTVTVGFTPPAPIAVHDTILYGTTATVGATSPYTIAWYASPTSDVVLDTGATFTTPVLYGNTAYYAAVSDSILTVEGMGMPDAATIYSFITQNAGWGLFFSCTEDIIIDYVHVYPTGTGTITIHILDSLDNTVLQSSQVFPISGSGAGSKVQLPVDLTVPAGSYKMGMSSTGITNLIRETSGVNYPYVSPSGSAMITAGATGGPSPNTGAYYWFYDWGIRTTGAGCESDRTEVWAIVTGNPPVDAGVVSIDEPLSPTNLQLQDAIVTIQNFGTDTLTSVTINWSNNGAVQAPFTWSGNLALSETESVNIGSFTPVLGSNNMMAWTSEPNGVTDPMPLNDTAYAVIEAFEPLCGVLSIGGPTANFPTFADALYALESYGVSCPVIFEVNPGYYNERIVLNEYTGVSATNTVTFRGQPGAVINYSPSSTSGRAVVLFDGAKHIRFDSLTINIPQTASFGWGMHVFTNSEDIEITNCDITTHTTSTADFYAGIIISGSLTSPTIGGNSENVLIENNTITGGYYGVTAIGVSSASRISDIVIRNNDFIDNYYYGIYLTQTAQPIIEGNFFNMRHMGVTTNFASAIRMLNTDGPFNISKNISINNGQYGIYISGSNSTTTPSIIANNMVGGNFRHQTSDMSSCLYITTSSNIGVYYNSFLFDAAQGAAMYHNSGAQTEVLNNSFTYKGGDTGYAYRVQNLSNLTANNNNNYYSNGSLFVTCNNNDIADLAALQAVNSPAGNDSESREGYPFYYSDFDLRAMTTQLYQGGVPIAGITDDFEGTLRDPITPNIGAHEFVPANIDAAVVAVTSPIVGCGLSAAENISVEFRNTGLDPITSLDISYSINGGTIVTETYTGNLSLGDSDTYTFTTTADFSAPGTYHIFVTVDLAGDQLPINDTLSHYLVTGHDFYSSEYFMGFEDNEDFSRWTVLDINNDGRTWEPGYTSISYAHTGTNSARFFNGFSNPGDDWLITECFTLEGGKSYRVDFWYRSESSSQPQNFTLYMGDDIVPSAFTDTLDELLMFTNTSYELSSSIVNVPTTGAYYFGWHATSPASIWYGYIDDINISLLEPLDAGIVDIVNIDAHEDGGTSKAPEVLIKNWGSDTLNSIPVKYIVNGSTPVTETWVGTLLPNDTVSFTFSTPFAIPNGNYSFCALTALPGDGNNGNDTLCITPFGIPLFGVPYSNDFEGPVHFYTMGANNHWERGEPTASVINSAHSPVNVWTTNLSGDYASSSNYNLLTPRFSFFNTTNALLSFWYWIDSQLDTDGGRIQYSTNNGLTWSTLGTVGDTLATNWYNSTNINGTPAFSGHSGGWVNATYDLSQFDNHPTPVQFRFNFFSDASINHNGFAIDDFEIIRDAIPEDAGVIAILSPGTQSVTGTVEDVEVVIENFGTDTLFTIPVRYRVNTNVPVQETWTGVLPPGETTNYAFTTTLSQSASYDLCAYTRVLNDIYTFNDTTCMFVEIIPAQYDAGVIEIIAPGPTSIAQQPVNVSARIKNFGTETLTSFDVAYDINAGAQTVETWTGTLAPDQEVVFDFTATYISLMGNYILCVETQLSNDQNMVNNRLCKTVTGIQDTTSIDGLDAKELFTLEQNIPNPTGLYTTIGFNIPRDGQVVFKVNNILGQTVYEESANRLAGRHTVVLQTGTMPKGLYYYSVEYENRRLVKRMVIH